MKPIKKNKILFNKYKEEFVNKEFIIYIIIKIWVA